MTLDYNNNKIIELKKIEDLFASAKIIKYNWMEKNQPCFIKIELKDNIPKNT